MARWLVLLWLALATPAFAAGGFPGTVLGGNAGAHPNIRGVMASPYSRTWEMLTPHGIPLFPRFRSYGQKRACQTEYVPALFEQLNPHERFVRDGNGNLLELTHAIFQNPKTKDKEVLLNIRSSNGTGGKFSTGYIEATNTLELLEAKRGSLPSGWVLHDGAWMVQSTHDEKYASEGTPLNTIARLMAMKLLGLKAGGLKEFWATDITNLRSVLKMQQIKREARESGRDPVEVLREHVKRTHTYAYAQTLATQSGHRIVRFEVEFGKWSRKRPWTFKDAVKDEQLFADDRTKDRTRLYKYNLRFYLEPLTQASH